MSEPVKAITSTIRYLPGLRFEWAVRIMDAETGAMRLEGSFKTLGEACEAIINWHNGVIII
jgi:hypothetical protein